LLLGFFRAHSGQFARIQPVPIAIGALVHFDSAFGAEEMPHQLHPFAPRAITLARRIDDDIFVALNFKQMLPGAFLLLINALKLERVEPDAAATALTNVYLQVSDLPFGQIIEARGAFHGEPSLAILTPMQRQWPRSLPAILGPPSNRIA
jgi:hypothetical protein